LNRFPIADYTDRTHSFYLPNGLKCIIHQDGSNPVLALQIYIRTGSIREDASTSGYSHFLEHLAFKNTKLFKDNQISSFISGLGGSINAYTDSDCTCYHLTIPSECLEDGLLALSELVISLEFNSKDVAQEKEIIVEEIRQNLNDPESELLEYIQHSVIKESPLKNPVCGTIGSVRAASFSNLRDFHTDHYNPQNAFLVLSGEIVVENLASIVEKYFGKWIPKVQHDYTYPSRFLDPQIPSWNRKIRKKQHDFICLILPELSESHPDSEIMSVALHHFAESRSSVLYRLLVEESRLCSSLKVHSLGGGVCGISVITVTPMSPDSIPQILSLFKLELGKVLESGVKEAELELIKQEIINNWFIGFSGVENFANLLGEEEFVAGYERLFTYDQRIASVSCNDFLTAVRSHWASSFTAFYIQSASPIPSPKLKSDITVPDLNSFDPETIPVFEPLKTINKKTEGLEKTGRDYYQKQLQSGFRLIGRYLPHQQLCGFALATPVSQLWENEDRRGFNYFSTSMLLHSTTKHDYQDILGWSRRTGSGINIEHHLDATVFVGRCFPSELPETLAVLSELITQPAFSRDRIKLLKSAVADSLRRDNITPASVGSMEWHRMLYGSASSYTRYTGELKDLRRISRRALMDWQAEYYAGGDFTLAVVGAIDPDIVADLADGFCQMLPKKEPLLNSSISDPAPAQKHYQIKRMGSGQAIINTGGFAVPASRRLETTAFHLLSQIIGGEMDSRLFNILREEYAFAYQTGFDFTSVNELGIWNCHAYCDLEDHKKCLEIMHLILDDVCQNGVTDDELERAKNYLCGMERFDRENPVSEAATLAYLNAVGYDLEFYLQREKRIRSITSDMVNDIARLWLRQDNRWTHILL
jgi:zinc protease